MTTQPNTEPLKVGEVKPCPFCGGEAHLRAIGRDWWRIGADHDDECYLVGTVEDSPQTDEQRDLLIAAWNRRTEPSPAEVGSEGVLTDEEIDRILDEAKVPELGDVPLEYDRQVARAIERALNQRLAVKEGVQLVEIESHPVVIEDKATFATLTDIQMALSKAGCPFVTEDGKLMSAVEQIQWLSTNPVDGNDDQQAKDAALVDAVERIAYGMTVLDHGQERLYSLTEAKNALQELVRNYRATTKQEEV